MGTPDGIVGFFDSWEDVPERGFMNTNHLMSFLILAETCSYQKAAEQLHYSRTTIMEHVRALEQELGTPLVSSQGRKLLPTAAGERFRVHAQSIMQTYQAALVEAMTLSDNQRLRIVTIETLGLYFLNAPLLDLIKRYPGIDLSVRFAASHEIQEMFQRDEADIAVLFSGQPWAPVPSLGLRQVRICGDEAVFFSNPDSWLAKKEDRRIEDLIHTQFILTKKDGIYSSHLTSIYKKTGVRVMSMQYIDSGPLLKQFVLNHDCVSMLSRRVIEEELRAGTLVELPLMEEPLMTDVVALYPASAENNSTLKHFIRMMTHHLKQK